MGLLAWSLCIGAQQRVKGLVVDAQGEPLAGIVVKALAGEDRLMGYAVSDGEGRYEISLAADREATRITLSGMGFRQVERKLGRGTTDLGRITMEEAELELREVTVKAPPVRTTGDTITYNVAQLKDKSDRTIEDVIKKIPGVEVDQQGRIKYQGEDINKFYIEGLDMLGGRYTLASQNISPDDIASISVYENHQPKRVLQGLEYSKQAALNLKMKRSSMLRPIVTATVGAGYGDEVLGLAEATGLFVAPDKQYLLTAKGNNAGSFYEKETTNMFAGSIFPNPLARGLLTSAIASGARIPRDRYVGNRSATASLNNIRKLKEDHTLSFNAGYYFNRLGTRQSQTSEYWQQDAPPIVTREDIRGRDEQHGAWLTLRYERNEKTKYLSEELNAEGTLARLTDRVDDGRLVRQHIRSDYYALDNRINAVWRRGRRLFTLNSDVALAQVPRSSLQAVCSPADSLFVGQDVEGLKFRTVQSTSYGWLLGRYSTLSLNARLQADYDRLSAESDTSDGLSTGYIIRTSAYPTYKFQRDQLNWEVSLPLHMIAMRFADRRADNHFTYNHPLASLSTSLNYRIRSKVRLSLGGSASRQLGSMRDLVQTPIHTTYRTTSILGSGLLTRNNRLSANASASYRNPLRGNNFMLSAQYQYGRSNRTSGSDVSPSATETLWSNTKSSTGMWLVNLSATKNLLGYATVLTASANLATLSTQSIRQGAAYRLSNNTLTLRGNSHTTLLNRRLIIDADLFYTLSAQKIEIDTEGNLRNEITPSLRLTASPVDAWEIYARANMGYIENDRGRYDDNFYLDAGVRYTHKRFEAELSGKNLTNRRDYTVRRYAVLDRFTYHYSLRPVEVLLSFRFKI